MKKKLLRYSLIFWRQCSGLQPDILTSVRIDGPRGGVNWAFFKILKQ